MTIDEMGAFVIHPQSSPKGIDGSSAQQNRRIHIVKFCFRFQGNIYAFHSLKSNGRYSDVPESAGWIRVETGTRPVAL